MEITLKDLHETIVAGVRSVSPQDAPADRAAASQARRAFFRRQVAEAENQLRRPYKSGHAATDPTSSSAPPL